MSVKNEIIMQEGKNNNFQGVRDLREKLSVFRRKVLRLYLQYVNPKLAKTAEFTSHPMIFVRKLLPENKGMWLAIASGITGLLVFTMPEKFWNWQIVIFISIFLLGPLLSTVFYGLRSSFYNLLVAYPGKHLLNEVITLEQPIVDGTAEVTLHGEAWVLKGDDCPAGSKVNVVAIKENILFVTRV